MPPIVAFDADVLGRRRTGDETWTREMLCALGGLRLPFRILAYTRDVAAVPERATALGTVIPSRLEVPSNYARALVALPTRLRADRAALFNGNHMLPAALPCPGVVIVHDSSFLHDTDFMPSLDRMAFRRFVPWSARRAARVVTVSEFTRRDLLELVPDLDPARVTAIRCGVSADMHPMDGASQQAAERFGLTRPYVLFVGSLERRKNLPRLLEAWRILRDEHPDRPEQLVIAGARKAGVADDIDRQAVDLGVASSVRQIGYVEGPEALRTLYGGARLLAFPSLFEGFGLPPLEAMACGTPAVVSNTTSLPEATGGAAVLVDPLDSRSIADGLWQVLRSDEARAEWVERGLAYARGREQSWTRAAEQLAGVYDEVLSAGRPTRRAGAAQATRVTVSVISTGEADRLGRCLASIDQQHPNAGVATVVVCNRPGDGSADLLRRDHPTVTVVERERPYGFSANHNLALRTVSSDFGLILNPDVILEPGCLSALLAVMAEHPRCGVVAPLLRYPDGRPQPSARRFPRPFGTVLRRTPLRAAFPPARYDAGHYLDAPVAPRRVDWLLGACLLVRRSAWEELGGFDERAFPRLYVEDIDLGWRMWQAGWEVWQTPEAVAVHEHQAATDRTFFQKRTLWHFQGMWSFVQKHPMILAGHRPGAAAHHGAADGA